HAFRSTAAELSLGTSEIPARTWRFQGGLGFELANSLEIARLSPGGNCAYRRDCGRGPRKGKLGGGGETSRQRRGVAFAQRAYSIKHARRMVNTRLGHIVMCRTIPRWI